MFLIINHFGLMLIRLSSYIGSTVKIINAKPVKIS